MLRADVYPVHHTLGMAALAADDLRNGQLDRLSGLQHDVVLVGSGQEVIRDFRDHWCGSNLPVSNVQASLL